MEKRSNETGNVRVCVCVCVPPLKCSGGWLIGRRKGCSGGGSQRGEGRWQSKAFSLVTLLESRLWVAFPCFLFYFSVFCATADEKSNTEQQQRPAGRCWQTVRHSQMYIYPYIYTLYIYTHDILYNIYLYISQCTVGHTQLSLSANKNKTANGQRTKTWHFSESHGKFFKSRNQEKATYIHIYFYCSHAGKKAQQESLNNTIFIFKYNALLITKAEYFHALCVWGGCGSERSAECVNFKLLSGTC